MRWSDWYDSGRVVQDMLVAHREDNDRRQEDSDRRQQVQLQMMLVHREETELRLIEARESADKQMRLLREMHEMAKRCRVRNGKLRTA